MEFLLKRFLNSIAVRMSDFSIGCVIGYCFLPICPALAQPEKMANPLPDSSQISITRLSFFGGSVLAGGQQSISPGTNRCGRIIILRFSFVKIRLLSIKIGFFTFTEALWET